MPRNHEEIKYIELPFDDLKIEIGEIPPQPQM